MAAVDFGNLLFPGSAIPDRAYCFTHSWSDFWLRVRLVEGGELSVVGVVFWVGDWFNVVFWAVSVPFLFFL